MSRRAAARRGAHVACALSERLEEVITVERGQQVVGVDLHHRAEQGVRRDVDATHRRLRDVRSHGRRAATEVPCSIERRRVLGVGVLARRALRLRRFLHGLAEGLLWHGGGSRGASEEEEGRANHRERWRHHHGPRQGRLRCYGGDNLI